jgi:amino acid permease
MASVGTISSSWNFVFSLSMTLLSYSLLVSLASPLGSITSSFSSSHALKVEISQDGLKS